MAQYYYTDGKERYGPFSLEELQLKNITPTTLVWKEGMADWMPASQLSELTVQTSSNLFSTPENPPISIPPIREAAPKNWLVESILVTFLCCLPLGIVAIINATKVESLWIAGQRDAAIKASQEAGKWVKIGFFAGIIVIGLYVVLMFLGVVAGFMGGGISE
jgi:hypothetical protein